MDQIPAMKWWAKMAGGVKLGVIPDRIFTLEYTDQAGKVQRVYFFLEADRGTMPVVRKGLVQTSFFRKLLAYEATGPRKFTSGSSAFRVFASSP
jgi:hypothetical protein